MTRVGVVTVDDLAISYLRAGSGEPLVLLHGGFGFDSRSWGPQLDHLADELDLVAWDAPGCGGSDDPPEAFSMADYADTLAGFIAALGLERPHVLGISFGAALALALYERHPDLPRSLILTGAYAGWAGSLPPAEVQGRLERISEQLAQPPAQWLSSYVPGMFGPSAPQELLDSALALMSDIRPRASLTMLRAMAAADLRGVLPAIAVPTLLLHGELDARSPLAAATAMHAQISGSRLVVIPGAGHACSVEYPEVFNMHVRDFLRSVDEAPRAHSR